MAKGRVLIIEDDEWVAALLAKFLRDDGYEVHQATGAQQGFKLAQELLPDCILCDVVLPDIDGFWVARKVRTEPSRLATTPFLFLTSAEDSASRLQGLNVGADVYITKPFRHEEVVAQVGALIDMAERLREQRDSFIDMPVSSRTSPALRGDIAQMSFATVLTLLEMERRTGRLKVRTDGPRTALFELSNGELVGSELDGATARPVDAIRDVLKWKEGRFWFRPANAIGPRESRTSVGMLLIEAMRLEDESQR